MRKASIQVGRLIAFLLIATILLIITKQVRRMPTVTISDNAKEIILTASEDGIIEDANMNRSFWRDKVIINVSGLKPGDKMIVYDLYSDTQYPKSYQVINIQHGTRFFGR
ncbi:hypothetical protein [Sphingobacterium hotanense]|uniref:Uncharacterized protein n=1 Tax=Sphingobacterium hotanense TaxID=649196 RepID=A0ABT7NLK9_9SPHI|nr:hypothetical protein [Sphingobacterium hotanense]MDM1048036.1 hypothetical protein [Sphingobacterium hotanense]